MKITFEQYVSEDGKSHGLKTSYDSIEYTQEQKEKFQLEILKHLGETTFPNGSLPRMKFETALWLLDRDKHT